MANQRGMDGSATIGAIAFDELQTWSMDGVTMVIIDDTVKGDTHVTKKGGLVDSGTFTLTGWLDYATAQQDVIDLINAGTGASVAFVLLAATGKTFTGNCIPQSYSFNSPAPDSTSPTSISMTMAITGAVGVTWA